MSNPNKHLVWVIEDDKIMYDIIADGFKEFVGGDFELNHIESVPKALKMTGHPEVILIDTTAIAGHGIMPMGCWSLFEANLGYLVEKHLSAVFGIYSGVGVWAEDLIESIQDRFSEVKITQTKREAWALKDLMKKSGFEVSEDE